MATATARGSIRLLYSKLNYSRHGWLFVPGIALAIASGVVPTLTAKVIGSAFEAFTQYNQAQLPAEAVSASEKSHFRAAVVTTIWQLCALAVGTMLLSTTMISTWIVIGERVASGWRLHVYDVMDTYDMTWFEVDLKHKAGVTDDAENVGAGGLMAKFARETDDIRVASAATIGQTIEALTTLIASLVLALVSCWSLALVVLATIPLMMIMVGVVQKYATAWLLIDMEAMALCGKVLEQSVQAITTVKVFNVQRQQSNVIMKHVDRAVHAWDRLAFIYGGRLGLMAWMGLMMFASGFWYGSHLVQAGSYMPGQVFTTFWSCVIISSTVGPMIQSLATIESGKVAAASLTKLVSPGAKRTNPPQSSGHRPSEAWETSEQPFDNESITKMVDIADDPFSSHIVAPDVFVANQLQSDVPSETYTSTTDVAAMSPTPSSATNADSPLKRLLFDKSHAVIKPGPVKAMRRIRPKTVCHGEINIQNVTFSYPSRPDELVLRDVSMFLPAGEMTFVLGSSGSGKSTISHLLLGLYGQYRGDVLLDDQDIKYLDPAWSKAHIAAVDQNAVIFDMSVHDNIALGLFGRLDTEARGGQTVQYKTNHVPRLARSRVVEACKMALLDQDIRRMPNGYNTRLGAGGVDLSGGQKQRLALARAIIRDPTVLILDEATSALDITNRSLVMALVRRLRRGKTTIVITHDLSQVDHEDFVYMLQNGRIIEQGYRMDLEQKQGGHFSSQLIINGYKKDGDNDDSGDASLHDLPSPTGMDWRASRALDQHSVFASQQQLHVRASRWATNFDFFTNGSGGVIGAEQEQEMIRGSGAEPPRADSEVMMVPGYAYGAPHTSLTHVLSSSATPLTHTSTPFVAQPSHQRGVSSISSATTVASSILSGTPSLGGLRPLRLAHEQQLHTLRQHGTEKTMELSSVAVSARRPDHPIRRQWSEDELTAFKQRLVDQGDDDDLDLDKKENKNDQSGWITDDDAGEDGDDDATTDGPRIKTSFGSMFWRAVCITWITQPSKLLFLVGLIITVLGGMIQPVFSVILGKLLATMGGDNRQSVVTQLALAVIGLAFADGIVQMLRFTLLQLAANRWVQSVRRTALYNVMAQDKAWFDHTNNQSNRLLIKLVKDPEDAKSFISRILGEFLVVVTMVAVVFIWAVVISWQLTLAGMALGPVFYAVIVIQSRTMLYFERQNKCQRERVSKRFFNMVQHVREARAMSLQPLFRQNFHDSVRWAERNGIRAAPYSGFGFGVKDACVYLAQAFLYFIGCTLMINGLLNLESMMVVYNLIIFGVTFAAHVLTFLPSLTKSIKALHDARGLLSMPHSNSSEHAGRATPNIQGALSFRDVSFCYPSRPEKRVLDGCSFDIQRGERVALVGQSGCGKSTVAALVQRLYEPEHGAIIVDEHWPLNSIAVEHIRSHMACVAQRSDLFDDTIRNNLLLANPATTEAQMWRALERACCTEFIRQFDAGLDTAIDEGASNLSGGQKQRLAIARALVRGDAVRIRIMDECTSALDPDNQERVASNLLDQADDVTMLIVTHKLELMKRCDRILVLEKGKVVQNGTFDQLLRQRGGAFSKLANAGEWGS